MRDQQAPAAFWALVLAWCVACLVLAALTYNAL